MLTKLKHLFGLCKEPIGFAQLMAKAKQGEPGSIVEISEESLHWSVMHKDFSQELIGSGRRAEGEK